MDMAREREKVNRWRKAWLLWRRHSSSQRPLTDKDIIEQAKETKRQIEEWGGRTLLGEWKEEKAEFWLLFRKAETLAGLASWAWGTERGTALETRLLGLLRGSEHFRSYERQRMRLYRQTEAYRNYLDRTHEVRAKRDRNRYLSRKETSE
jgi:hypothetical protein